MDAHHKAYALNQMGKSAASLFADLVSFDPENIPTAPPATEEDETEPEQKDAFVELDNN